VSEAERPTNVRHRVIGVTTLAAVMLYLDRVCIAEIAKLDEFKASLGLTEGARQFCDTSVLEHGGNRVPQRSFRQKVSRQR